VKTNEVTPNFPLAEYHESGIEEYDSNILISALPRVLEDKEVMKNLLKKVNITDAERALPPNYRSHSISKLDAFFQPFDFHLDYAKKIDLMLRHGYKSRNPLYKDKATKNPYLNSHADSVLLTGPSGIGKTKTTLEILSFYDQVIVHEKENLTQVVWLKIECPSNGSLKSLCFSFFQEIQLLLKNVKAGDYQSDPCRK